MGEIAELLRSHGIAQSSQDEEHVYYRMTDDAAVLHRQLSTPDSQIEPLEGAEMVEVANDRMAEVTDAILHKLHHNQIILIPVGKWRSIFDAVAFSLAQNEEWQAIDAAATVELNSRDPLLSDTGDLHLLCDLVKALMQDSETPDQGLMVITAGVPLVMEIVPAGGIRMSFGNQAVAEEVAEAYAS
tara:strand:+ start:225 stop:782 length:558 start_codon:yes stop_codon:yes gene_type:complete